MANVKNKLYWQAFSIRNRIEIIEDVKDAILGCGACILDFKMFSDLALSLIIEIEEGKITDLHRELKKIISIDELDQDNLRANSQQEWLILMNVSFGQGEGKLKVDIPMVPG